MWHEIFSKYSPHSQALIFTHSCSHSHVHQIMLLLVYMLSYKLVFTYILSFEFVAYEFKIRWIGCLWMHFFLSLYLWPNTLQTTFERLTPSQHFFYSQ
jgi:hypothetical protein